MSPTAARLTWSAAVVAVIVLGFVFWWEIREPKSTSAESGEARGAQSSPEATTPATAASAAGQPVKPALTVMPIASELAEALTNPGDPTENLRAVEQVIGFYRSALGENPVGQNEDITAAILGENPAHAAFLPPNSPAIREGKLIDSWGTPYWFHPVSSRRMEIRSAGPDRELFTSDDLTLD